MNDTYFFKIAEGFLELKMPKEALKELKFISSKYQNSIPVLRLKIKAHKRLREWQKACSYADHGCDLYSMNIFFFESAFCLHELKRSKEARDRLLEATFDGWNSAYYYNLACYEVALGEIPMAKKHLSIAFSTDEFGKELQKDSVKDHDLKPLWDTLPHLFPVNLKKISHLLGKESSRIKPTFSSEIFKESKNHKSQKRLSL